MKFLSVTILSTLALASQAQVIGNAMDHIGPGTADLTTADQFASSQVYWDLPEYSSTLIDDFYAPGLVTGVAFAFETADSFDVSSITGWRVSIWDSVSAAQASGNTLDGGALFTSVLAGSVAPISGAIPATGSSAYLVSFESLGANVGVGMRYVGVAAILDFGAGDQIFALQNSAAPFVGNATPGDAIGINPAATFGESAFLTTQNAAYRVDAVPEPATCTSLLLGAAGLLRRRITRRSTNS